MSDDKTTCVRLVRDQFNLAVIKKGHSEIRDLIGSVNLGTQGRLTKTRTDLVGKIDHGDSLRNNSGTAIGKGQGNLTVSDGRGGLAFAQILFMSSSGQ